MLSRRLTALVDFIGADEIVADVGSDHGLLLLGLAEKKNLKKGYAMDIAEGPLKQAEKNIAASTFTNIETILAPGLSQLPADVTVVVIAGMGFNTIKKILEDDWDKLEQVKEIVIQCNSQVVLLRGYLAVKQVAIVDELWVNDYKDYQFIKFNLRDKRTYSQAEIYFGPCLLKAKTPEFIVYYRKHRDKLSAINRRHHSDEISHELELLERNLEDFF